MLSLLARWIVNAAALLLVAYMYPGVHVESFFAAAMAALVLGLINAVIRPILVILTLPVTLLTLGCWLIVHTGLSYLVRGQARERQPAAERIQTPGKGSENQAEG